MWHCLETGGDATVKLILFAVSATTTMYLAESGLTVVKLPTDWIGGNSFEIQFLAVVLVWTEPHSKRGSAKCAKIFTAVIYHQ